MKPALVAVAAIVVLGGASVAIYSFSQGEQSSGEARALVEAARAELQRDELDRDAVVKLARRISEEVVTNDDRDLDRALARLELALGRVQRAWQLHVASSGLDPELEDLLLSARILLRRHGERGERALGDVESAAHLAERHYDAVGAPDSLFMAWQGVRRAGDDEEVARIAAVLTTEHAASLPGRLVALFGDPSISIEQLRALELEFLSAPSQLHHVRVPEELEVGLAFLLLSSGGDEDPAEDDVAEALGRLERVLATYPASVGARSALVMALHLSGERDKRNLHLDWLLANASPDDTRRSAWRGLKEQ